MIVRQMMNKNVLTLSSNDTLRSALDIMTKHEIRHIPIVSEDKCLEGIITERDIKNATPSVFETRLAVDFLNNPIESIMIKEVITGHPLDFVEELAPLLIEHKIGCIPIVQDGRLKGILTETDLLTTFIKLTGADQPSSRVEVKVPNKAGMLAEVSSILKDRKVNISSVLVYPDLNEKYKILVFRIQTMNVTMIIDDLQDQGYHVLGPNAVERERW